MKSLLLGFGLLTALLRPGEASGRETHVYRGKYSNYSDILYTWDGEHLYRGKYANYSDIVLTFDGSVPVVVMLLSVL